MKRKSAQKQNSLAKAAKVKKASRNARKPIAANAPLIGPETSTDQVVIYRSVGGKVRLDVHLARDTVWLTQVQMAMLFGKERSVVTKHINNVFAEGELTRKSNVQILHIASSDKPVAQYSLDAIISVGYRVKSKQGTQFRIWATQTLREHLLRGYTLHEKRLREKGFTEIEQAVELLSRTLANQSLVTEQGRAVLDVVQKYTRAWRLLLEYDEDRLPISPTQAVEQTDSLTPDQARIVIGQLRTSLAARNESTDLFGRERGEQLHGLLGAIEQTFGGEPLYPTVQARAAHILYFVIKDHPFSDGNKRIGTLLFLDYLRRNGLLLRNGELRLADTAMVALALLIAESDPKHKDLMIRLTLNLLEDR